MKRAGLVLLAFSAGCASARLSTLERQMAELRAPMVAELPRLGGEEASAPVASLGTWVPVAAATKSLLGQAALPSTGSVTISGSQTITGAKTFSSTITSTQTGTNNAIAIPTNTRINLGASVTLYGDGTGANIAGYLIATGGLTSNTGITAASFLSGQDVALSAMSLPTCNSGNERKLYSDTLSGGTSTTKNSKLCWCRSDGAASPTYAWVNAITGTVGNTTTCGTE